MRFISLFTGVGGFDLGFERAGMECVAQAEQNPHCLKVLEYHYPDVKRYTDVRQINKDNTTTNTDVLVGGFPCQDVSVAGRRAGLAGERSGLWFEFLRILHDLKPTWVVIENVPGLLSSNRGRDFATVLYGLGQCGYKSGWRVLDAQYWGVAQRRRRVFIVGCLRGGRVGQVLFEREGGEWNTPTRRKEGQEIARTLRASADNLRGQQGTAALIPQGYQMSGFAKYTASPVARTLGAVEYKEPSTLLTYRNQAFGQYVSDDVSKTLTVDDTVGSTDLVVNSIAFQWNASVQNNMPVTEEHTPTLTDSGNGTSGMAVAYNITFCDTGGKRKDRPNGGLYVNETEQANTLTSSQDGTYIAQSGVRRLTPMECERLQGFPDSWTNIPGASDSQRYRQMGNAVCVPVARWLGDRIMKADAL